jgi:hypothetical protein
MIMADNKSKNGTNERNKVNSSQKYEVSYIAKELGVSPQAIAGAKRATGSNDRKDIEHYIKNKSK